MRRQKQVCLSAFVNDKTEIPNKKLSLPSKNISLIDQLNPYLSSSTQSLNLHNNRIASLKGIQQFTFLKELDISQNKIQNCQELAKLKDLYQLKKLYLSNNPFLNQPIPETILDFILDKETDIQILSFQILSTLKDVQERQIKIIFLKNYIQKIDMHAQLKDKKKLMHQKTAMEADQILNKIVPQFYTLIQDPKIINKIKREAIDKKKQTHDTLQEALEVTKNQKQEKIDQLVKNIVGLLHENQDFKKSRSFMLEVNLNDNTITFSPQRRREANDNISLGSQQFSPVKYIQMSKDDASIEEISLTNTKHNPTAANTNTKQFQTKVNEQTLQMYHSKPTSPSKGDFDNLQTARKHSNIKTLSEKMQDHNSFKQSMQSQIKKIKQRQSFMNSKIAQSQYIQQKDHQTPQKKGFDMSKVKKNLNSSSNTHNFIKVIQQNQDESQQNKQSLQQKEIAKQENNTVNIKKFQTSSLINQSSIVINDQMTPEMMETVYFKTLAKTNPMFSLLHSPSNSLNNQQKTELLQALKIDHKEKFLQLIKEKLSNQQLMKEIQYLKIDHLRQKQSIVTNNKHVYNQYLVYKQQFEWIDQRQRSIQQKNQELALFLKQTQANDKKKATALKILENNYKKLKEAYAQKHERLIFLENSEDREEAIRQKHQANILKKYQKQMNDRASILAQVAKLNKKVRKNRQRQLLEWGMESFIFTRIQQKDAKHLLKVHESNILKEYLNKWKIWRQLLKKEKKIQKRILQKRVQEIVTLFKENQAQSKMKKLKYIWAKRFLEENLYKKSMKKWKNLKEKANDNIVLSINHMKQVTQAKIFKQLRQIASNRRSYIDQIYQKRSSRLIIEEFQRMLYIMKKETVQIEQKYRKNVLMREKLQREAYFRKFISYANDQKQLKIRKAILKRQLAKKNLAILKKVHKLNKRKLAKLTTFCHKLNFGVYIRMMRREKFSNDYSDTLLKRRKISFFKNLRQNYYKQSNFHKNEQKMALICDSKLHFSKLKFLKTLEVCKLKGKNYVKHRAIQQMNHQMDINELNTIDLIRSQKQEVTRCEKQVLFLKSQIQGQSIRELALLRQKDEMMLSINESYEIMMELRREVDAIRSEYGEQEQKYNALVTLYNQSVAALQKKERDYEWLYDSIRDHRIK